MLVAISDIHFVDGTAGEHNLPYSAFESVFLSDLAALAADKGAEQIRILLLGDIVDLIRSTQWLEIDPEDRPWGSRGLADIPEPRSGSATERQCLKILGRVSPRSLDKPGPPSSLPSNTILHKNWKTFRLFRDLEARLEEQTGKHIPTQIIYVVGNHDRLCNLYPSLRLELQRMFGLTVAEGTVAGDPSGRWWYRYDFEDEDHGVFARHGHQFDLWNFGGGSRLDRLGHLQPPIGDLLTTEFAVKIPWLLDRLRKKYPRVTREMVESTRDIDNVRPLSAVMKWIYYRIKREDQGEVRKAFHEVLATVVKELLDNRMIQQWRSPSTHIDEALRIASSRWLSWLPKGLVELLDAEDLLPVVIGMSGRPGEPEKDLYARAAYGETVWKSNQQIRFILYGHTHVPLQLALDGEGGHEVFYLNTGTWRNRIHKTIGLDKSPDFVELKQMTYSIFYREDEDLRAKEPGTLSFDVWSGLKKKHYRQAG